MSVDPYIRWLATAPAVTLPSAEGDVIENMADTGPGLLAEFLGALQRQLGPIDPPVPMKGAQGLRDLPADVEDILAVRWAIGGGA